MLDVAGAPLALSLNAPTLFRHLSLDYRWGTQVWPPLNSLDSGVMYLSTGPLGAVNAGGTALSTPTGSGGFMVSMEYQIAPGDVGGMYNLGPISFQAGPPAQVAEMTGAWNHVDTFSLEAAGSVIPEPGSLFLLGSGAVALFARRRQRKA